MGNSSSSAKADHPRPPSSRSRPGSVRQQSSHQPSPANPSPRTHSDRNVYALRTGRGSRPDLSFLHLGARERDRDSDRDAQPEPRRETKQEREARKVEKERIARDKERDRSMREEGVDGGYLVTLGTYTGAEDFSKPVVRQLMIERRLAPFWKGLNDHSDSWAEHQLVAAARGLPIPAADEVPPEMQRSTSQASNTARASEATVNSLTVPISSRSHSYQSDHSATLSPSHPAFSTSSGPTSLPNYPTSTPLFRGRAKTLASLGSSKTGPATPITPQEVQLPKDPYVNGQPLEAYLYKDAAECPICFLYYPPYLNRTRCCDQSICSECFVQIKRPDPHPPEHHDDASAPAEPKPAEEEGLLVSEPSACPFCVTPEFGVTYECPPFRRGLAYAGPASGYPLSNPTSAMSSSTSLASGGQGGRRRTTSLSASAPTVITTDRVRPDWAKKLADARAHALRRSAAATALHNAAYMLGGNNQVSDARGFVLGRRRRGLFADSPSASGSGTPRLPEGHPLGTLSALLAQSERNGNGGDADASGRTVSRRTRVQDLEELMMMEAIRLSLAAEDERKKKEDKEIKKEEKKKAKDAKKAEKTAKKQGGLYQVGTNNSSSTWASMARSTSNLGSQPASSPPPVPGKGKAPISANTSSGFNPLSEPTSTLNTETAASSNASNLPLGHAQRHLEESRANLQQPSVPISVPDTSRTHGRHLSNASSVASSLMDSTSNSYHRGSNFAASPNASGVNLDRDEPQEQQSGTPSNSTALEPMFNFRSLAAMIGEEDKSRGSGEHVEFLDNGGAQETPHTPRNMSIASSSKIEGNRSRGDSGESSSSSAPSESPFYVDADGHADATKAGAERELALTQDSQHMNHKHANEGIINHTPGEQLMQ
ncbi:hypothetical protein MBLNU459_g2120t1 [Dothideomycetes sp. NU459]